VRHHPSFETHGPSPTHLADKGKGFATHKTIAGKRKAPFYFSHPDVFWERDLNEHSHGLVRQTFPKNHAFATMPRKEIDPVMDKSNDRLRKCLGIKTPTLNPRTISLMI